MASAQPVRQPSQRRAADNEQSTTEEPTSSPARARSEQSEDSQTVVLSTPILDESQTDTTTKQEQLDAEEVKECWVCRADSSEDGPDSSPWRDPCPCALVAHEECLLDWIASKENERATTDSGVMPPKIQCPQCKAPIKLSRPRDYIVDIARAWDRAQARAILPGAVSVFAGTLYYTFMAVGKHSVYAIFGAEDGHEIMRPLFEAQLRPPVEVWIGTRPNIAQLIFGSFVEHLVHWKLYIGVPLIAPILILSRTSLADPILPVLPLVFLATQGPIPRPIIHDPFEWFTWPPSAGLAFSLLPYARQAYNASKHYVFGKLEQDWLRAIQPRAGEQADGDQDVQPNARDDGNLFEVRIEGDVIEEWEDEDGNRHEHVRPMGQEAPAVPANHFPADAEQADPPPNIADNRPAQNAAQAQPAEGGGRRLAFSPVAVAESVLGALVFPSIAGLSGELLKTVLPTAWTTLPAASSFSARPQAQFFLQNRWARSLIGGCLVVVLKDAVLLYTRWRMAQIHRHRRVVDIDRSRL